MKIKTAVMAFDALSHYGRMKIFRELIKSGKKGLGATKLTEIMDIPAATLSFHMSKLINGDLVTQRKTGKFVNYHANEKQITKIVDFLLDKYVSKKAN